MIGKENMSEKRPAEEEEEDVGSSGSESESESEEDEDTVGSHIMIILF